MAFAQQLEGQSCQAQESKWERHPRGAQGLLSQQYTAQEHHFRFVSSKNSKMGGSVLLKVGGGAESFVGLSSPSPRGRLRVHTSHNSPLGKPREGREVPKATQEAL